MKRKVFTLCFLLLTLASVHLSAQAPAPQKGGGTVTFTFAPGNDMFILQGNETELQRLYELVDEYRSEITAGRMPLYVDGYCASLSTAKENLNTAFVRANRVKSELILHKSLKESHFITKNYATAWQEHKDIVTVTLRLPEKQEEKQPAAGEPRRKAPAAEADKQPQPKKEAQPAQAAAQPEQAATTPAPDEPAPSAQTSAPEKPYLFALRTNLLYDALLLPTLGIEWRINGSVGIKLDGSLSRWGGSTGKVQKIWMLNPEVRWYLLRDKRFYVGASGNYGEYNLYKYLIGGLMKDDTGYQGKLWNAGLTLGYQLRLSRALSLDFNLGLGYTRSEYDSFTLIDGVRVYKDRAKTKNFWGPTQAGISLLWTIGGNK